MKQKVTLRLFLPVLLACATLSAKATVFFNDNFTTGSTTNGISNPNGGATSYDIASTKNVVGQNFIVPGEFNFQLNGPSTSAFIEAQALFTNNPVTLALPGDFIDITIVFTNGTAAANTLFNGTASSLWIGLYDSGGTKPLAGDLANGGLSTVAGSAFATGNCANWKGYVAQMQSGGTSRYQTRAIQNVGGTASANQDLVANNFGGGAYNQPAATVIGTTPGTPTISLTPGGTYTAYYRISVAGSSSLTFSNAIYAGPGTGGTLVFAATNNVFATNATYLTANFDGLAIGTSAKTTSANPEMSISSITISGTVSPPPPPTIVTQPVSASVATNCTCAFVITTMGFGQTYQWHRHGTNLNAGGNISISTSPDSSVSTLIVSSVGLNDAQTIANGYWVTVTGAGNLSTNSTTNSLTLRPSTNLVYNGAGGAFWDLTNTASWKDPNGNTTVFNYGDAVTFDDSIGGGSRLLTITQPNLSPMSVTVANFGASYTLNSSGGGAITGPGVMSILGGAVQINVPNTYSGGTIISNNNGIAPIVQLQNLSGLGTGPVTFVPSGPGSLLELQVAGSASAGLPDVHVNESATLQLDGTNTFAGVILGSLTGTAGKTLSVEPFSFDTAFTHRLRVYGTNVSYDANLLLDGPSVSQAMYNGTVLAPYNNAGVQTYTGTISGNGGVVQRANGTTILAGQSTYSGGTFLTTGAIGVGANSSGSVTSGPLGTGPIFLTPEVGSATGAGTLLASGGSWTIANQIKYPSVTNNQTLVLGGVNALTLSGAFSLNALDVSGSPTNRIIQVSNTNTVMTLSGVISDGGQNFSLMKTGPGILSLANTETYGSNTLVNAGTLAVNGTVAGSGLFVATNSSTASFLGGTGTISCPVVISNGAALAPGNSIGILTVNNNLTLFGNMLIEVNTNAAQNCDKTVVSGALTNAGTGNLVITNVGTSALQTGNRFFLFNKAMSNGAALNILSPGITATWSNGLAVDGSIQVLATIPITPVPITVSQTASTLTMSWPANYLGWSLQSNSVGVLATNSWFIVPGSSSGTSVTVNYDKTKTNVFYRMSLP